MLVHYVGGAADEDEWIPSTSERLRYADTKLSICKTKVPQTSAMRPSDTRMSMRPLEEEERKRVREGGMEGGRKKKKSMKFQKTTSKVSLMVASKEKEMEENGLRRIPNGANLRANKKTVTILKVTYQPTWNLA